VSISDRPSLTRTWDDLLALRRLWPALTLIAGLAFGGWRYLESRFAAATVEARALRIAFEADSKDRASAQAAVLERLCMLERELVDEVGARVSYQAADAEPTRARRAETARAAVEAFEAATERWPCPLDARDRAERARRPLSRAASSALATSPPR